MLASVSAYVDFAVGIALSISQPGIIHTDPRPVVGCGGTAPDVGRSLGPLCRVVVGGSVCEMPHAGLISSNKVEGLLEGAEPLESMQLSK